MTRGDLGVNLIRLRELMQSDGVDVTGELRGGPIGKGKSNLTCWVQDEQGRRWVVRRPPRGRLLAAAHDVRREQRILAALQETRVLVPGVVGEYVDDELAEAPVVVMEHVEGLVLDAPESVGQLSPSARAAVTSSFAAVLSEVHAVDIVAVGLDDLASHAPYAERQLRRWTRQWEQSRLRDLPDLDRLTAVLSAERPEQRDLTLLHGDFHLRNVIVDSSSGQLRAVLDWELSTLGDPLADVGTMLAYWSEPDDPATALFSASSLPGFSSRDSLLDAYASTSGRDVDDIGFWHALGLWKIAIIAEGIVRRSGGVDPTLPDQLVSRAWRVVRAAGLHA